MYSLQDRNRSPSLRPGAPGEQEPYSRGRAPGLGSASARNRHASSGRPDAQALPAEQKTVHKGWTKAGGVGYSNPPGLSGSSHLAVGGLTWTNSSFRNFNS